MEQVDAKITEMAIAIADQDRTIINKLQSENGTLRKEIERLTKETYKLNNKIQGDKITHIAYYGKTIREMAIQKTQYKALQVQLNTVNKQLKEYDALLIKKARKGWMDDVDFQHEVGEALGGSTIYPSKEDLEICKPCIDTSEYCFPIEVLVLRPEDLCIIKKEITKEKE